MTRIRRTAKRIIEIIGLLNQVQLVGCEVGVWKGDTSALLLAACPGLHLHLVDSWKFSNTQISAKNQEGVDAAKEETLSKTEFASSRRTVVHKRSVKASNDYKDGFFDFVYIDANHLYECVKEDLESWYPKIRMGGILMGHDYDGKLEGKVWGVKRAVDEFVEERGLEVIVNKGHLIFEIRKP